MYIYYLFVKNTNIQNVNLPEGDRLNTVVNNLRSAFPMINND